MMYLIAQTWLFLLISLLIGVVCGFAFARDRKLRGQRETESELHDERARRNESEKENEEFRARIAELEGLPQGARASRVAAREEMLSRITTLERELENARGNEKRYAGEAEQLRKETESFRTRYLEARAKWDEYQAKAEALASAPAPLNLKEAQIVPDETLRAKVMELEGHLAEARRGSEKAAAKIAELEAAGRGRARESDGEQGNVLKARIAELEGRLSTGISAARENDALRSRVADLQDKLGEAEVALSRSVQATKQEAEPLRKRVGELEGQLSALKSQGGAQADATLKAVAEATQAHSRMSELESRLQEAQRNAPETQRLKARVAELEAAAAAGGGAEAAQARIAELERALERARKQAEEAQSLRMQVASLESRLETAQAAPAAAAVGTDSNEEVGLLKARLAEVEARLTSSSRSSMEFDSLRNRVMTLEALLHEAAKSRDEAAILRSKVAELDGRLGQALKAVAETRSRPVESEKV